MERRRLHIKNGSKSQKDGAKGERRAALFLRMHGYKIIERNYLYGHKEIDIIARKGDTYAFVEVKASHGGSLPPSLRVDSAKRKNIASAARGYCAKNGIRNAVLRLDIIEVDLDKRWPLNGITHFENAFQ